MSEASHHLELEAGRTEFGELLPRVLFRSTEAGLAGVAVLEILNGYDARSDAVHQQFSDSLPTATGEETGTHASHVGTEISTAGEIGIIAGPMIVAALATTLWARWQQRRNH